MKGWSVRIGCITGFKNAYWFAHQLLGIEGAGVLWQHPDLPVELGPFDTAVCAMVLSHLRDPLLALASVARLVTGSLIVTNAMPEWGPGPLAQLIPSVENGQTHAWWWLSKTCMAQYLRVLGFKVNRTVECKPLCIVPNIQGRENYTCMVAERVEGQACLPKPFLPAAAA